MGRFSGTDGVGIIWLKREDYSRFLAIVADPDYFSPTFDEWLERAQEAVALVEREGGKPVRVETSPDKLLGWCAIRGLKVDSYGRQIFASDPANWPAAGKH